MSKAEEQKQRRLSHEAFLKHFVEETKQDIPMWAYVDLFTISDISILYKISESDVQKAVALKFGLNTYNSAEIMVKFMHEMTILRNLCAHGSRLFNRIFITKANLNSREKKLLLRQSDGTVDNAHLFGYIGHEKAAFEQ